jgi:hypothetical protein
MKKTIIIDVDGTILEHRGGGLAGQHGDLAVLPGVRKKWEEWNAKGYNIIVLTGRKESMREETERQLFRWHLAYDQLVTGVGVMAVEGDGVEGGGEADHEVVDHGAFRPLSSRARQAFLGGFGEDPVDLPGQELGGDRDGGAGQVFDEPNAGHEAGDFRPFGDPGVEQRAEAFEFVHGRDLAGPAA